jgi:hypothetical protein
MCKTGLKTGPETGLNPNTGDAATGMKQVKTEFDSSGRQV